MSLKGSNNEEKIWNYLKAKGLNDYGISGLIGNLHAESALIPTNLQNSYEKKLGFTDTTYTNAVDNGTYNNFVKDSAGYGLAQWTYWSRKQNLLDFAKSKKASIGDLEMQLDFLYKELSEGYKTVLNVLKTAKSIREASNVVLLQYERPADQSEAIQIKRANYGETYYKKYATTKLSIEEVAREVISGKWGNGTERKTKLESAGYNYSEVCMMPAAASLASLTSLRSFPAQQNLWKRQASCALFPWLTPIPTMTTPRRLSPRAQLMSPTCTTPCPASITASPA